MVGNREGERSSSLAKGAGIEAHKKRPKFLGIFHIHCQRYFFSPSLCYCFANIIILSLVSVSEVVILASMF